MKSALLSVIAGALLLAGCTSSGDPAPTGSAGSTVTSTVTNTRDTGTDYRPPAATYVPELNGSKAPQGEKAQRCPYIRTGRDQDPTNKPNVSDIQGNRIRFTTVLTGYQPVGCRFYFQYGDQAVADILPTTFPSAIAAHNAMVRTGQAGTQVIGAPGFVAGVDGISYRTKFYRKDKGRDWAFVFAKGKTMVVVHTEETTTSFSAVNLAKAIVGKF